MKSTSWIILASIFLMAGNASGAGIKDESDPWGSASKEKTQFFKAEDVIFASDVYSESQYIHRTYTTVANR